MGNIVITENNNADFSTGSNLTLVFSLPANFEFLQNTGSVSVTNNRNLQIVTSTISSSQISINYNCSGNNKSDQLTISGLQIRASVNQTSTITRSGGTGLVNGLVTNTALTNNLKATFFSPLVYRTKSTLTGQLDWNSTNTWVCGVVPPTDGSADVYVSVYQGDFSASNLLYFRNANVKYS